MSHEPPLSPAAFGRAFQTFFEQAVREEKAEDPPLVARLADHLDADPRELPTLTEQFSVIEHPNVRAALDAWISGEDRSAASPRAETPNHQASSTTPATSRGTGSPGSVNEGGVRNAEDDAAGGGRGGGRGSARWARVVPASITAAPEP